MATSTPGRRRVGAISALAAGLFALAIPVIAVRAGQGDDGTPVAAGSVEETSTTTTTEAPSTTTTSSTVPPPPPTTTTTTAAPPPLQPEEQGGEVEVALTASDVTIDTFQPVKVTAAIHADHADKFHKAWFEWGDGPGGTSAEGMFCEDEDGERPGPLDVTETQTHRYEKPGTYTLKVYATTVECGEAYEDHGWASIQIRVTQPEATWVEEDGKLRVEVSVSDTTPNPGEKVEFTFRVVDRDGGHVTSFEWHHGDDGMGDGGWASSASCAGPMPDDQPDDPPEIDHVPHEYTYEKPGTYEATFKLTTSESCENNGSMDTATVRGVIRVS